MGLSLSAAATPLGHIQHLIDAGAYREANSQISSIIAQSPSIATLEALLFEQERMRRIELEFTLDEKALATSIRRYLPDASEADIAGWKDRNLLESLTIDGQTRYFNKAAYNLMHIDQDAAKRSADYRRFTDKAPLYALHQHHQDILANQQPLRNRLEIHYTLTVNADAVPAGETVRAWLPFPQFIVGQQEAVTLLSATPTDYYLAPEKSSQRTIYFERRASAGTPTEFAVRYAIDSIAHGVTVDPEQVTALPRSTLFAHQLNERAPHIVFTPALRQLSLKLVGGEQNPYRIAQKLFDYVDQIPWAGAREYSTISNISDYALHAGHADCGQQTLLLMTLMRLNGIPTRWQSGWEFGPEHFDTMHDWGEFYIAPYGWLPMDVTHGQLDSDSAALRWFYLGRLDAYRLIFNTDYSQTFSPPKQHWRSETVDSQRGEVEWAGGNLYFDQWDYHLDWTLQPQTISDTQP